MNANTLARKQAIVDEFNKLFPVGSAVLLLKDIGEVDTVVREPAWLLGGHTPVAMFQGISGAYAIEGRVLLARMKRSKLPTIGNVDEAMKELRAAGLDAWDEIPDPAAFLKDMRG